MDRFFLYLGILHGDQLPLFFAGLLLLFLTVGGRHKPEKLKGQCAVTALVHCDNGAPAARVVGLALKHGHAVPKTLVIVDPSGVVRGVARSSTTSPLINRAFYLGKVKTNGFLGYIRDYNPQLKYAVRSADNGILSEEEIPVRVGGIPSQQDRKRETRRPYAREANKFTYQSGLSR